LKEAAPRILEAVCRTLDWELGGIWILDKSTGNLRCLDMWSKQGLDASEFERFSRTTQFPPGVGLPGRVWQSGKSTWIRDVVGDDNFPRGRIAAREGIHGAYGFPIRSEDEVSGVIEFFSREVRSPDRNLLEMMEDIGRQIGQFAQRKRTEVRFEALLESAPDALVMVDGRGRITQVNAQVERIFGYGREELLGQPLEILIPERFRGRHPDHRALYGSDPRARPMGVGLELFAVARDGTEFPVDISLSPLMTEEGLIVMAAVRDISERRRAQAELAKRQAQLAEAQEIAHVGSWEWDMTDGRITWSDELCRIYGVEVGSPISYEGFIERVHPEDRDLINRTVAESARTHAPFASEHRIVLPDEAVRTLYGRGRVVTRDGQAVRMVGTSQDITERKRLEDQLRQAQKLESVGTLAGGVAHDFNNILNIISAYAALISRASALSKPIEPHLETIQQAVERGTSVVRQLLTVARKGDAVFSFVDLNRLVEGLALLLRETFPRTISIVEEKAAEVPAIEADAGQLDQALLNLCVNARDAMPDGGTLVLKTEVRGEGGSGSGDRHVCVSVSDSGVGMEEATRRRIFEPFFTTKKDGSGTGLGLAVVYGIVRSHGGSIEVETEPGRGSTFCLGFPVAHRRAEPESVHASAVAPPVGGQETILLVEDETTLLGALRNLLEAEGYRVLEASDGLEAVAVHRRYAAEIALVVADLGLPKLGGWEAFLRMKEADPNARAILVSGILETDTQADFSAEGVRATMWKPYTADEMLRKIRAVLDGG